VYQRYLKFIGIYLTLFVFLSESIGLSYAVMTMDEIRDSFKKKTEKKWEEVTSEERKDFLYKIRGKERIEEREERVEGVKIPFHIREGFKRSRGKKWEEATEEEQRTFIEQYKRSSQQWKEEDAQRLQRANLEEQRVKELQVSRKAEIARRIQARQMRKAQKRQEEQQRRQRMRDQVQRAKEKIQQQRAKAAAQRNR